MANEYTRAERRANAAKQLRDRKGRWIEMGAKVRFLKNGVYQVGEVVGLDPDGTSASVMYRGKDGSPITDKISGRSMDVVAAKASIVPDTDAPAPTPEPEVDEPSTPKAQLPDSELSREELEEQINDLKIEEDVLKEEGASKDEVRAVQKERLELQKRLAELDGVSPESEQNASPDATGESEEAAERESIDIIDIDELRDGDTVHLDNTLNGPDDIVDFTREDGIWRGLNDREELELDDEALKDYVESRDPDDLFVERAEVPEDGEYVEQPEETPVGAEYIKKLLESSNVLEDAAPLAEFDLGDGHRIQFGEGSNDDATGTPEYGVVVDENGTSVARVDVGSAKRLGPEFAEVRYFDEDSVARGMSAEAIDAAVHYSMSRGRLMNAVARRDADPSSTPGFSDADIERFRPWAERLTASLDSAVDDASLPEDTTVYRGASFDRSLEDMGIVPGGTFTDAAFLSTTTNENTAEFFANLRAQSSESTVIFELDLPAGYSALALDEDIAPSAPWLEGGTQEVVLPRDRTLRVASVGDPDGKGVRRVKVELAEAPAKTETPSVETSEPAEPVDILEKSGFNPNDAYSALERYTMTDFKPINSKLRGLDFDDYPLIDQDIAALNALIEASDVTEAKTVYRGVSAFEENPSSVAFLDSIQPGSIITDSGFMSATGNSAVATDVFTQAGTADASVLFEIPLEPGDKALDIDAFFSAGEESGVYGDVDDDQEESENEYVLPAGTSWRVAEVTQDPTTPTLRVARLEKVDTPAEPADETSAPAGLGAAELTAAPLNSVVLLDGGKPFRPFVKAGANEWHLAYGDEVEDQTSESLPELGAAELVQPEADGTYTFDNVENPQVPATTPSGHVALVDVQLKPVLEKLWEDGLQTRFSHWSNGPRSNGTPNPSYISFTGREDAENFAARTGLQSSDDPFVTPGNYWMNEHADDGRTAIYWDGADNEQVKDRVLAGDPVAVETPVAPDTGELEAPQDGVVKYDSTGRAYVSDASGNAVFEGDTVTSSKDGLTGVVAKIEGNGRYVQVRGEDGVKKGRRLTTLTKGGVTPPEPSGGQTPIEPTTQSAPAGDKRQYDEAGQPFIGDGDGEPIYVGGQVVSRRDGLTGTVVALEKNGAYVQVMGEDGKKRGRKADTLDVSIAVEAETSEPGAVFTTNESGREFVKTPNGQELSVGDYVSDGVTNYKVAKLAQTPLGTPTVFAFPIGADPDSPFEVWSGDEISKLGPPVNPPQITDTGVTPETVGLSSIEYAATMVAAGNYEHSGSPDQGGMSTSEFVELPDGSRVFRKVISGFGNNPADTAAYSKKSADAEVLSSKIAAAIGVDNVNTAHVPNTVDQLVSELVPGVPASEYIDDIGEWEQYTMKPGAYHLLGELGNAREIALLDFLVGNEDRHLNNWFIDHENDTAYPIDHGLSFTTLNDEFVSDSPFVMYFFGDSYWKTEPAATAESRWTVEELEELRGRLLPLEPDFSAIGRESWYQLVVERMDNLIKKGATL